MPTTLPGARESVDYRQSLQLGDDGFTGALDLTSYTFACAFTRQAGTTDFTLGMAADNGQGFTIVDGPGRLISITILAATLQGVPDTTGDFTLFADLLATPPGGDRFLVGDLTLPVTKGPTA